MFEGAHAPPFYLDLYNFPDGAQEDIFADALLPIFGPDGTQTGTQLAGIKGSGSSVVKVVTPTAKTWPTETPTVGFASKPSSSSASSSYYGKW